MNLSDILGNVLGTSGLGYAPIHVVATQSGSLTLPFDATVTVLAIGGGGGAINQTYSDASPEARRGFAPGAAAWGISMYDLSEGDVLQYIVGAAGTSNGGGLTTPSFPGGTSTVSINGVARLVAGGGSPGSFNYPVGATNPYPAPTVSGALVGFDGSVNTLETLVTKVGVPIKLDGFMPTLMGLVSDGGLHEHNGVVRERNYFQSIPLPFNSNTTQYMGYGAGGGIRVNAPTVVPNQLGGVVAIVLSNKG